MKHFILTLGLSSLFCTSLLAQKSMTEYDAYVSTAEALYNKKEYLESAKEYSVAFNKLGLGGYARDRYNAARSWALAKVPDSAFSNLQRIAEKSYYDDVAKISEEDDLISLHSDKRWQPLMALVLKNKENKLPDGFFRAGSKPGSYAMTVDKGAGKEGNNVITLRSIEEDISGFGTVMKNFALGKYLGKKIKMTGYLKTKDVEGWAAFWLRIDGEDTKESLAFDNMKSGKKDRSISGTTDWERYDIVLEVSNRAKSIAYGTLLSGTGQVWFDKIEFEIVDDKVETTGLDQN